MTLTVALNYGGRVEIVDACRALLDRFLAEGRPPSTLTEADIARHLYTTELPDPDLLVRTSGEMRISNFLLWQIAYSEIYVTDVLWPDFRRPMFLRRSLTIKSEKDAMVVWSTRDVVQWSTPRSPA
jgi:undecaprenyl diphosphate synthase